jgi:hypothetical protein
MLGPSTSYDWNTNAVRARAISGAITKIAIVDSMPFMLLFDSLSDGSSGGSVSPAYGAPVELGGSVGLGGFACVLSIVPNYSVNSRIMHMFKLSGNTQLVCYTISTK